MHTPFVALLSLLVVAFFAMPATGASSASDAGRIGVEYIVDLSKTRAQLVNIEMRIPAWEAPHLDVHMPVWRPGRYEVLDLAGGVRLFEAEDAAGNPLAWEKTEKASWRISTPAPGDIAIRYQLYCNSLSSRTRHADETHAFLSGSAVFLYCHERRAEPVRVTLDLREGWRVACGLDFEPGSDRVLLAPDYDTLVDSPIEAGIHDLHEFDVDGVQYQIAVWGRPDAMAAAFPGDVAKIATAQQKMFHGFPFNRYVFITHLAPGAGGGTEHLNSTVIGVRPSAATEPKDHRGSLALASHELFHTWNVKQFRPAGLKPYDYQRENYTTLLWVAEGTTSYYDELLCLRAGVWETKHYLESLGKTIDAELARPGRSLQSLEESSFDAWIKFNRATPDAVNSTVSFYSKGALVSLMLDARIRTLTSGAGSLDDVMRTLSSRFPHTAPGYTTADVLDAIRYVTGEDFTPFFNDFVRGTADLPINDALAIFGLEAVREGEGDEQRSYLGLDLRDADGLATVSVVRDDGPGPAAGINVDDQIVALNGQRLRAGELDSRLKQLKPGQIVTLHVIRRDLLREVRLSLASRPKSELKVQKKKDANPEQKAAFESWSGQSWGG
ncbi:MAG: M61 family metallopeptidase [Phycisphaerales bacterium]|nr:M61 family metallopeptidase [Phycisphaerales bacterium]